MTLLWIYITNSSINVFIISSVKSLIRKLKRILATASMSLVSSLLGCLNERDLLLTEKRKKERALARLKTLYLYSESDMPETEYFIERKTITDELEQIDARLEEIEKNASASFSISDEDFIAKASYFIMSQQLLTKRYVNFNILLGKQMIKYTPESHSVKINKNLSKIRFSDSVWESLEKDMNYSALGINDNDSQQKILLQWETGQWYVLNDLMQKRWMAFMWGEGYIYQSFDDKTGRTDIIEKTHKYLKPYIDIFNSDSDRIRQTMEIILVDK